MTTDSILSQHCKEMAEGKSPAYALFPAIENAGLADVSLSQVQADYQVSGLCD